MADQEAKRAFENEEKDSIDDDKNSIKEESNDDVENEPKFKKATNKLKAEALRRFKLNDLEDKEKETKQKKEEEVATYIYFFYKGVKTLYFQLKTALAKL